MNNFEKRLRELIGMEDTLLNVTNALDVICGYSLLDYANEEDYINNESITVTNEGIEYNIEFEISKTAERYIDYTVKVTDIYEL